MTREEMQYYAWVQRQQQRAAQEQQAIQDRLFRDAQLKQQQAFDANQQRRYDILGGLVNTRDRVLGDVNQWGDSLIADTNRAYDVDRKSQLGELAERGLGNSTVRASIQNRNREARERVQSRNKDTILENRTAADERLSNNIFGFEERVNDVYPDMNQFTELAYRLGQSGAGGMAPMGGGNLTIGGPAPQPGFTPPTAPVPRSGPIGQPIQPVGPTGRLAPYNPVIPEGPAMLPPVSSNTGLRRRGLQGMGRKMEGMPSFGRAGVAAAARPMPNLPKPLSPSERRRRGLAQALNTAGQTGGRTAANNYLTLQNQAILEGYGNWQPGVANGVPAQAVGGGAAPRFPNPVVPYEAMDYDAAGGYVGDNGAALARREREEQLRAGGQLGMANEARRKRRKFGMAAAALNAGNMIMPPGMQGAAYTDPNMHWINALLAGQRY